ncbi:MAG: SixA phosphatase family protein [Brevefilum sp.]
MKTLLLMRHAKSSWKDDSLADHERPLKKRGHKDTKQIAKEILKHDLIPQLILSSTATRARETVETLTEKLNYQGQVLFSDELYMGEPQDFIKTLKEMTEDEDIVMIVAHNPGLEAYLQIVDGEIESLPTGGLGYLLLALDDWKDISLDTMGDLIGFWKPKELRKKDKS